MKKIRNLKPFILVCILVLALVFIGMNVVKAQEKGKGKLDKPPGKDKPPDVTCIDNGMCEMGEYDYGSAHDAQTCLDCLLKDYSPLLMVPNPGLQIVGSNSDIGKVFQFKSENENITDTWASIPITGYCCTIYNGVGDVDGDGKKEILAVGDYKKRIKGKIYYEQKIFMYRDDSDGTPIESERFGSSRYYVRYVELGDVNNDGVDELILDKQRFVEIYSWNGSSFDKKWSSPEYSNLVFRVDVGDADNDGYNELVFAMFEIKAPIMWDFDVNFNGEETVGEPINVLPSHTDILGIDHARARDADNDGSAEIIAGGNNNRLMVWKYLWDDNLGYYRYKSVLISEDLGGWTQGIDAGDVDGDGNNEVIVGTDAYVGEGEDTLYIFDLVLVDTGPENYTYRLDLIDSIMLDRPVGELSVGDVDNDGKDEIVVRVSGRMDVYEYEGGILEKTYSSVYGRQIKVR